MSNIGFKITKNVNSNVNNRNIFATAKAEAFGLNALAKVDAYTYVNLTKDDSTTFRATDSVNNINNTINLELGVLNSDDLTSKVTLDYKSAATEVKDPLNTYDDLTGIDNRTITIPLENSYLGEIVPNSEFEFEAFGNDVDFFTDDDIIKSASKSVFELTSYLQKTDSLEIETLSNWGFQEVSQSIETINDERNGEAFSYAHSTVTLDLNNEVI